MTHDYRDHDLRRIADALTRIASVLENLTVTDGQTITDALAVTTVAAHVAPGADLLAQYAVEDKPGPDLPDGQHRMQSVLPDPGPPVDQAPMRWFGRKDP